MSPTRALNPPAGTNTVSVLRLAQTHFKTCRTLLLCFVCQWPVFPVFPVLPVLGCSVSAVTVMSFRGCCFFYVPSSPVFLSLSLPVSLPAPPAPSLSPSPPLPPVFQLETYQSEPQRLDTRRLRSFSSPADTALCSSSSSWSSSPPVGPGLQGGRLVSDVVLTLVRLVPSG